MQKTETTTQQPLTNETVQQLNQLLLVFPAAELRAFYSDKSQHMLLKTSTEIEQHEAMAELLRLLDGN
jgi:hypothetical protein